MSSPKDALSESPETCGCGPSEEKCLVASMDAMNLDDSESYVVSKNAAVDGCAEGAKTPFSTVTDAQKAAMNVRAQYIGIHLHLDGQTAEVALGLTMRAYPEITDVQIFTHGPQSMKPTKAYNQFAMNAATAKVRIWTHGSYLCVPWKDDRLGAHTVQNILASKRLGSHCTVAHIPFSPVKDVVSGLSYVVREMRAQKLTDVKLMLETSATVQDTTRSYESAEKLNALTAELVKAGLQDCVRICIDTAHIFAGRARIATREEATLWWKTLDTTLLGMIHLNGTSIDPNVARGDKHEVPMSPADLIWGTQDKYASAGCSVFVENARRLKIPIILEVGPRHLPAAIRRFITDTKP